MSRASPSDVKEIFDTDLSNSTIQAWLDIANTVVDDIKSAGSNLSSTRLTQIEKLLAAHFASSQDKRVDSASRETASVTFAGETGMNLNGTRYGQQAKGLDPTNTLAGYGKTKADLSVPDAKQIK